MFGYLGTAIRFFLIGLGVGLLTAPRSGRATRVQIQRMASNLLAGATGIRTGMVVTPTRLAEPYQTQATGLVPPAEEFPAA